MDLKFVGYFVSVVSVFLLGVVSWPKSDEPSWKAAIVVVGMATSIVGMGIRYAAHRKQKREVEAAKRKAARA